MDEQKKSTKRFLVIYCIAIFVFAVALIMITYISQQRSAQETSELQSQLISAEQKVKSNSSSLKQVQAENEALKSQLSALQTENNSLKSEKETIAAENDAAKAELEAKNEASQKLIELLDLKLSGSRSEYKKALKEFNESGLAEKLSPEALEIFDSLN